MHELWVCKSILEIIKQKAAAIPCTRVKKLFWKLANLLQLRKNR